MTTTTSQTRHDTTPAAPTSLRGYDWRDDAACTSEDPELFFPPAAHVPGRHEQTVQAKAVCARCPVRAACLEYALDTGQKTGVWGGLSEQERKPLHRLPETHAERCWDNQVWIEEQLAAGVSQRRIAEKVGVPRASLCRVLPQFESERANAVKVVEAA